MKKCYYLLAILFIGMTGNIYAKIENHPALPPAQEAFIFTEGGVEFAVYPDGQFDFLIRPRHPRAAYKKSKRQFRTFNSGYAYGPYVQFDDYGAVIQVAHVPIFYDYYGRITRAGNVDMFYNQFGRLSRIGNLNLHYNRRNHYTHTSGFINVHNAHYAYQPWHELYRRPNSFDAVVYHQPYRTYYDPYRLDYEQYRRTYKKHSHKDNRRTYYRPGDPVTSYHRGRRTDMERTVRSQPERTRNKQYTQRSSGTNDRRQESFRRNRKDLPGEVHTETRRREQIGETKRVQRSSRPARTSAPATTRTVKSYPVKEQHEETAPVQSQRTSRSSRVQQNETTSPQVKPEAQGTRSSRGRNN
jgi:hypothetical protein